MQVTQDPEARLQRNTINFWSWWTDQPWGVKPQLKPNQNHHKPWKPQAVEKITPSLQQNRHDREYGQADLHDIPRHK